MDAEKATSFGRGLAKSSAKFARAVKNMAGKAATETAHQIDNAADMYRERQEQARETSEIRNRIQEQMVMMSNRRFAMGEMLKREYEMFSHLIEEIEKDIFRPYRCLSEYVDMEYQEMMTEQRAYNLPSHQTHVWSAGDSVLMKGLGVGMTTATAAVGMTTLFGTASTGTAIASLHGSAYLSSLLACLGGGSLATGGMGMLGGMAVLGAAVTIPAAGTVLYGVNKKIKKDYAEAKQQEEEVLAEGEVVSQEWEECADICQAFRQVTMAVASFRDFFKDMLDMGVIVAAMGKSNQYQPLLNDGALTLLGYINLPVIKDEKYNPDALHTLDLVNKKANDCRQAFYQFFIKLSSAEQECMEKMRGCDFAGQLALSEHELEDNFGRHWKKLNEKSRLFLVTGKAMFSLLANTQMAVEYSGVCIALAKALELELKKRLFCDFCSYVEAECSFADMPEKWPEFLCHVQKGKPYKLRSEKGITLGSMAYLCGSRESSELTQEVKKINAWWRQRYGHDRLFTGDMSDEDIMAMYTYIGIFARNVADIYRNPAAHGGTFGYRKALECLDYILHSEKGLPWLMQYFGR